MIPAQLIHGATSEHISLWETNWKPLIEQRIQDLKSAEIPTAEWPQDLKWNWQHKLHQVDQLLAYQTFALMCENRLQGLMLTQANLPARLKEHAGKDVVYINFLQAAPWNRRDISQEPRFSGVGINFIAAAIQLSLDLELKGRLGLHSLPQSVSFYEGKCGMTSFGLDPRIDLPYFEMTSEQASKILKNL